MFPLATLDSHQVRDLCRTILCAQERYKVRRAVAPESNEGLSPKSLTV